MHKIVTSVIASLAIGLLGASAALGQVVYSDDFNNGLRSDWITGSRIAWQSSGGIDNSPFVKVSYLSGGTGNHVLSRTLPRGHQELYFKFNFRVTGYPSGGSKFLKVRALQNDSNYANTTWGINYDNGRLREVSYGGGSSMVNDTQATIRYNGVLRGSPGDVNIVHSTNEVTIPVNQWHTFEAHMRYNSDGKRDGVYRVWFNGQLILHATNIKNRHDNNPLNFNWLYLGNYSHNTWSAPWELHYDNLVVSTQRMTGDSAPIPVQEPPPLISQPTLPEPGFTPEAPVLPASPPRPPGGLRVIR
jgi:hypothetical protein